MTDDYEFWRRSLNGEILPVHPDDPQCGTYRMKTKSGKWLPVVIWREDGKILAEVNGDLRDAEDIWSYVAAKPVSQEHYEAYQASGKWWDDAPDNAMRGIGDNNPPSDIEQMKLELMGEKALVEDALSKLVADKEQADQIAALIKTLTPLSTSADTLRKAEKQPFTDGGRAVDAKWRAAVAEPKDLADKLRAHLLPFMLEHKLSQVGRTGQKASLRASYEPELVDFNAALEDAVESQEPELEEALMKIAARRAKSESLMAGVRMNLKYEVR